MKNNSSYTESVFSFSASTFPYIIFCILAVSSYLLGLLFTYVICLDNVAKVFEFVFAISLGVSAYYLLLVVINRRAAKIRGSFAIWLTALAVLAVSFITGADVQFEGSYFSFLSVAPSTGYFVFFSWFLNYKLNVQKERDYFSDEDLAQIVRWSYISLGIGIAISFVMMRFFFGDMAVYTFLEYIIFAIYCGYRFIKYLFKGV